MTKKAKSLKYQNKPSKIKHRKQMPDFQNQKHINKKSQFFIDFL